MIAELDRGALDELRKELAKTVGPIFWGNDPELELRKLPIGVSSIDAALDGGFAFNRMAEIIGEDSSGKTLIALLTIKAAQQQGLPTAFIDVERTWDPGWATTLGINVEDVLVSEPRTGEKAFDVAVALVQTKPCGVLVIDSLAAMTADAEVAEGVDFSKKFIGGQAQLINRGLKTITSENAGWLVICINQLRSSVGIAYGNPETLPGGKGQKFYAWHRVRVRRGAWIEEAVTGGKRRIGYQLRVIVEKNKQGAPFKEATVPFYFTGDIDELAGLVEMAIGLNVIVKDKAYYTFEGEKHYGLKRLTDAFRADAALADKLRDAVENVGRSFKDLVDEPDDDA